MKIKICPICFLVSGAWLAITVGIWLGFLTDENWRLLAALFMGGSVVGIAYQRDSFKWKIVVIILGVPFAYLLLTNISALSIVTELILLAALAYFLFLKKALHVEENERIRELEEKMKSCC